LICAGRVPIVIIIHVRVFAFICLLFLFAVFAFVRLSVVFAFVRACGCVRFVSVVFGLFLFCGFRVRAVVFFCLRSTV
jgi:hypothetical protein